MKNIMKIRFFKIMTIISIISLTLFLPAGCRRTSICRELQKEEIRPMLTSLTGSELPTNVEDIRAIFFAADDIGHYEILYVAIRTDQKGCEDIMDIFGGKNVQIEEFPLDENNPYELMSGFEIGCDIQEDLGVDLFDKELINQIEREAMVYALKGHYPKDVVKYYYFKGSCSESVFYTVLIFKDRGIAYIIVNKEPPPSSEKN